MTILAISLYILGVIGAVASVGRDAYGRNVPTGPREIVVCVLWLLAVAAAIAMSPFQRGRK
ncbi:hypothetical protein JYP46_19145 [Nitratireductor aquimarinus]|uniref:hypothetical protein n=1 Tax=Alphaproteobacteria TaxID=28211 RepID=UPI0019D3A283|nr:MULTISPECIES: hypothetical protein [Alphaproteobacteria]MBN7758949.1 hypothetical protein [Nitratireductor aquimarinus]MBY6001622.1 hypothetical protein [Tritonibacter mobilis]MBY6023910.1 hypothetical protein [Nitratireductor sp. DP7N14-4]